MRILLISSSSGSQGGGEIYLRYLAEGLRLSGCDVQILLSNDPSMDQLAEDLSPSAKVTKLPLTNTYQRRARSLGAVFDRGQRGRVRAFIDAYSPDVVHVNQQVAEDGLDLLLAASASGRPLISTIHITHSAKSLGARLGVLRDFVAEHILLRVRPRIICVSEVSAAMLRSRGRLCQLDVSNVYPAVPSVNDSVLKQARADARRQWGASDDEIVVGAVGRLESQKNPLFLLDAFADAAAVLPNLKLVWVGDGAVRPAFEIHARTRGLEDRVIVEGWRDDARFRMAGLDIFAMPSRFEGLPLALLEAMHAGLAICASGADGIAEAIEHGRGGLILPTSANSAWCNAFCSLARNDALRRSFGATARKKASESFGVSRMVRETLELYERCIA